ncbi:hypothetical protein [Nocardia sp. NPDC057272]|uniref:hypothetical protein n=1 Tax=Nocardia sp. NPDC057272 TaxID=3346079 RepID=UPI00362A391E
MTVTPQSVAREIWRDHPEILASQRRRLDQVTTRGIADAERDCPRGLFDTVTRGSAITTSGVDIEVVVRIFDAADLGSFPTDDPVTAVEVAVRGHATSKSGTPQPRVELPDVEVQGWAYAVLGRDWYEPGYFLRYQSGGDRAARVMVLLDPAGCPICAPADFYFAGTTIEKVEQITFRPLATTDDRGQHPDSIADNERPDSLKWQVGLTGTGDSDVQAAAQALLEALRPKGAVAANFALASVRVDGHSAVVGFTWRDTGRYAEEQIELPRDNDFTARTEFYQRAIPRVAQSHSAHEWANQVLTAYQEAFATGFLGYQYLHPDTP